MIKLIDSHNQLNNENVDNQIDKVDEINSQYLDLADRVINFIDNDYVN